MAMQDGVITGYQGNVVLTGDFAAQVVKVSFFRAKWTSDMYSGDFFGGTNTGHKSIRGMYRVSGTINFHPAGAPLTTTATADFFEPDAAAPRVSAMTLTERTGHTWTGNGRISDVELSVNAASGLNEYTGTFESDGNWICTEA